MCKAACPTMLHRGRVCVAVTSSCQAAACESVWCEALMHDWQAAVQRQHLAGLAARLAGLLDELDHMGHI